LSEEALGKAIQPLMKLQEETNESLKVIQTRLTLLSSRIEEQQQGSLSIWPWLILIAAFVIQIFFHWFFR
jgi:hypothetical protein